MIYDYDTSFTHFKNLVLQSPLAAHEVQMFQAVHRCKLTPNPHLYPLDKVSKGLKAQYTSMMMK